MWVASSAQEIEERARAGDLPETPGFDAKAELPHTRKNVDLAKDVAAMATDGGVLLYGVAEDEHGNPTKAQPIELVGAPERVSQIVSTSIAEVPFIDLRPVPCADDPSRGYLVVIVPQSARAPHMVTVNGDHRYYGRDAKGNRILTEGDVARLYERRQRWEVDREQVLRDVVDHAPVAPQTGRGYVHAYTRPAAPNQGILERALETINEETVPLVEWFLKIAGSTVLYGEFAPSLERSPYLRRHGGDMWRWATLTPNEIAEVAALSSQEPSDPTDLVTVDLNIDGRGQLFCGRATDTHIGSNERVVIEVVIAGNVESFFAVMGALYEAAGYHGAVDVGLAVTGVKGAYSERGRRGFGGGVPYPVDTYTRTARIAAAELRTAPEISQALLRHFFESTTGIDGYNPWTESDNRQTGS
jgi:hypothetical protein